MTKPICLTNKVQEYFLPFNEGQEELVRSGQFVYENNDSDIVCGFISTVNEYGYNICLFDALDTQALPVYAHLCAGPQSIDWVMQKLELALLANPSMREQWVKALWPEKQ